MGLARLRSLAARPCSHPHLQARRLTLTRAGQHLRPSTATAAAAAAAAAARPRRWQQPPVQPPAMPSSTLSAGMAAQRMASLRSSLSHVSARTRGGSTCSGATVDRGPDGLPRLASHLEYHAAYDPEEHCPVCSLGALAHWHAVWLAENCGTVRCAAAPRAPQAPPASGIIPRCWPGSAPPARRGRGSRAGRRQVARRALRGPAPAAAAAAAQRGRARAGADDEPAAPARLPLLVGQGVRGAAGARGRARAACRSGRAHPPGRRRVQACLHIACWRGAAGTAALLVLLLMSPPPPPRHHTRRRAPRGCSSPRRCTTPSSC